MYPGRVAMIHGCVVKTRSGNTKPDRVINPYDNAGEKPGSTIPQDPLPGETGTYVNEMVHPATMPVPGN